MRYTVIWTPTAEQELARIWLTHTERGAVTAASSSIDDRLARDPENCGQVYFDTVRTFAVPPLGVDFEILEADRLVYVLTVWESASGEHP